MAEAPARIARQVSQAVLTTTGLWNQPQPIGEINAKEAWLETNSIFGDDSDHHVVTFWNPANGTRGVIRTTGVTRSIRIGAIFRDSAGFQL